MARQTGNPNLKKAENTRLALNKFGKYLVAESRKNLTKKKKNVTGNLYQSLAYEITAGPNSLDFDFLMAEYGEWVDKGRKAGKMPPFGAISLGLLADVCSSKTTRASSYRMLKPHAR